MLPDEELVKAKVEEFLKSVDEVVKPYFDKFDYKRKIERRRSRVLFEKAFGENLVIIEYYSYAKFAMNRFRVTFYSERKYLHFIEPCETSSDAIDWEYENENELKKLLDESVKKIDEQQLLQTEENNN